MGISYKFLAVLAAVCALTVTSVAFAAGLTVKTTPSKPKLHQKVEMRVSGLKPGERVKAVLTIVSSGQKNAYFPKQRASSSGLVINTVVTQVKGKQTWSYTGRQSHRKGSTTFTVR